MIRQLLPAMLFGIAATVAGADHTQAFELTDAFVRTWAEHLVSPMRVTIACAGPVHDEASDCELHIGAQLVDPSISDFQSIVLEPPNICMQPGAQWRAKINALSNQECTGTGFVRAWPEHLDNGSGCSNPDHFMEVHPMTHLTCGSTSYDFTSMLSWSPGLGFKAPSIVHSMEGLKLWVCRQCSSTGSTDVPTLSFDYCFGSPCKRGHASNFARYHVRVLQGTIRPRSGQTLDGFATVIARVAAVSTNGHAEAQFHLLKLYAIQGTPFYDTLLAQRDKTTTVPTWDVIGIFTIDPFSVLKIIEKTTFADNTWTSVDYPVSLVVFGTH